MAILRRNGFFVALFGLILTACASQPTTYSQVLAAFPASIRPCAADVTLREIVDGNWLIEGRWVVQNGVQTYECPGAKLMLNVEATINGNSYDVGTLLVMDHKNEWIKVISFD